MYILEIVQDILDKLIHNSRNVCRCLTLNEMHIKLASLIISSTNSKLINTSSTPPPEVKKTSTVYSSHNNFVYLNRNLHLIEVSGYKLLLVLSTKSA